MIQHNSFHICIPAKFFPCNNSKAFFSCQSKKKLIENQKLSENYFISRSDNLDLNFAADRPSAPRDATRGGVASRTPADQAHAERRPDHSGDSAAGGHRLREFFQVGHVRAADRVGG